MNSPRKKQVITLSDSHGQQGVVGAIKKHLNTALTVLLLIAAGVMFIRWRMRSAEAARMTVATELGNARTEVQELQPTELRTYLPPAEIMKRVSSVQDAANSAISDVLGSSDADARMRAENGDALLQKAWDAYQEVIKNSTYADQHEQLSGAHLGLAAIAENRGDWNSAKSELDAVVNDPDALEVLKDQAKVQLNQLPLMQKKIYLAPPTGIAPGIAPVLPAPAAGLIGPPAPNAVPSTQFTVPAVAPTTMPSLPFKP